MTDMQKPQATITLLAGRSTDSDACGRICYEAFEAIARQHNLPPDFPSVQAATDVVKVMLSHPGFFGVVAEADGQVIGSNFLDERSAIVGIGPITVAPKWQNVRVGRRLM